MKKLTTTALALAFAGALAASAQAQVFTSYTSGDLLLGFEQSGNAQNYLVDIGSAANFSKTATLSLSLSTTDLTAIFGASWASNSAANLVQWGVVGNDQGQTIPANQDGVSIFYTKGEAVLGTPSEAPIRGSSSALNVLSNKIQALDSGSGGYDGTLSTANSAKGIIQSSSAANSWSSFNPSTTAFGIGTGIEQPATGSATGPTNSKLDLWEVDTKTGANQPATLLGYLSLGTGGVLNFTGVNAAAVPEPASYALGGIALLLFIVLKRRKSISSL